MDLGIAGKTAIVCGASAGMGLACAQVLAEEGVNLVMVARSPERLEQGAESIRSSTSVSVDTLAADMTSREGRTQLFKSFPHTDILITNLGGSPKGEVIDWDEEAWMGAVSRHMISAAMLMRHYAPGMGERRFGRIVNILSRAIRAPEAHVALANAPRSGLAGFVGALSREIAWQNVTINNILPGPVATATQSRGLAEYAKLSNVSLEEFAKKRAAEVPAKRFGDPLEIGTYCAFLCSANAGYIVGQNLLIDGGAVNLI